MDKSWLRLRWRIEGCEELVVPKFSGRGRADGLWQTTCFELFLRPTDGSSYIELNMSPSERWAAYRFSGYRADMTEQPMPREPDCALRLGQSLAIFDVAVPAGELPARPWQAGLTAVVEERGGVKSFWAAAHPAGKPDFHHPDCFTVSVAAPGEE